MIVKDQVAIVTGGTKGIGRAICLLLAEEGARVVANFSKHVDAAEGLMSEAKTKRLNIGLFKADITQFDQVKEMVEETFAQYGKIDILVNNVGLVRDNFLMLMSDEDWDALLRANLTSLFYGCKTVIRKMIPQRRGKIINISSISGILGTSGQTNYAAAKMGLVGLMNTLKLEGEKYNIRVNTICPGMVVTEMVENSPGLDHDKCLYPEDIADLAIWLLTRRSNIKIATPVLIQTMLNPWK